VFSEVDTDATFLIMNGFLDLGILLKGIVISRLVSVPLISVNFHLISQAYRMNTH
jgi:hypothetical protein